MKPELTLTQLEREPLVHFGCTWSEIKTCVWRGGAMALPITAGLMALAPVPPLLLLAPGLLLWLGLAYGCTQHIHRHRAGKPLYYERHRRQAGAARAPFIRAGGVYQTQRGGRARAA